jgi:hypothetical protein
MLNASVFLSHLHHSMIFGVITAQITSASEQRSDTVIKPVRSGGQDGGQGRCQRKEDYWFSPRFVAGGPEGEV